MTESHDIRATLSETIEFLLHASISDDDYPQYEALMAKLGYRFDYDQMRWLPARDTAIDLASELAAALDNAVLHHGQSMAPADLKSRRELVERANQFLAQASSNAVPRRRQ
ncbi:hypothetical protein ACODYM_28990 [Burkholderia gladioli]|uniref:hypothetical protein n=1 Tax=Burkholderia gladioli TaxID=28095 RepID=UPI003B51312C